MDTNDLIPTLALVTLVVVALAALIGLILFKRKPANQHPMEKSPDGAVAQVRPTDQGR